MNNVKVYDKLVMHSGGHFDFAASGVNNITSHREKPLNFSRSWPNAE